MEIFNFFGNIFGYLLWGLYLIVRNYGVAIILFTLILKLVMFPFSVKQQKSSAAQSRLAAKQKEIQQKYGNDKTKYAEEMNALYQKEGASPMGGCLTALIPFPIMMGLYYAVIRPLSNVLHFNKQVVSEATDMLNRIPGVSSMFNMNGGFYREMNIVQHFGKLKPYLTMFSDAQISELEKVSRSFNFLGLDLLGTPQGSAFSSMLWLIPVLCLVTYWGQQFYMERTSPAMRDQQGCMKYSMYLLPLVSVYFAYRMPGAIGFYWIVSAVFGFIQSVITNKFYGPVPVNAMAEAQRAALRFSEEEKMKPLSYQEQKALEDKIYARSLPAETAAGGSKPEKSGKKKSSQKKKTDDYLGSKR